MVVVKDASDSTLAASCIQDNNTGDIILKLVNAGNKAKVMKINLMGFKKIISTAEKEVLTGAANAENTLENPQNVVPVKSPFKASKNFQYETQPMSLTVIRIKTKL